MVTTILQPLRTAKGIFHDLELYPDKLVIKRTDVVSRLFNPEQVILLKDIVAVYLSPAQFLVSGWMQVTIMGHDHRQVRFAFRNNEEHNLRAIRETIEDLKSRQEVVPILETLKP